ncbi:hypothetical protein PIB30_045423 [Stylosanthes scabra]|uniref:Uncharacterized protein n=1 Tax=Stylosanthes scabra TaxID=79078 RepID=A0ABU6QFR8_9FABA|nr:hypothetical protein [Stylosanthes scabra]
MSTRRGESRIPWASHLSFPTDSTVSSATSRLKRQLHIHRSPSRMLGSGGANEDAAEALPPPDFGTLSSDEQTTPTSPQTVHILEVPRSTVPHMSSISTPEGPTETSGNCFRQD